MYQFTVGNVLHSRSRVNRRPSGSIMPSFICLPSMLKIPLAWTLIATAKNFPNSWADDCWYVSFTWGGRIPESGCTINNGRSRETRNTKQWWHWINKGGEKGKEHRLWVLLSRRENGERDEIHLKLLSSSTDYGWWDCDYRDIWIYTWDIPRPQWDQLTRPDAQVMTLCQQRACRMCFASHMALIISYF